MEDKVSDKYCIVSDDDGHNYIIPVNRKDEFDIWLASEDAEYGIVPDWAEYINGPTSSVIFEKYSIE